MNLIRWNNAFPAKSPLTTLFDEFFNTSIADIVGSDFTTNQPSVNITEEDDKFVLELAVPGLNKENFSVEIDKDQLIVSAEQKSENAETEEGKFTRREFNFSSFKRSFYLPKTVDKTSVDASYNDGLLAISLSKTEEAKEKEPTVIEIK